MLCSAITYVAVVALFSTGFTSAEHDFARVGRPATKLVDAVTTDISGTCITENSTECCMFFAENELCGSVFAKDACPDECSACKAKNPACDDESIVDAQQDCDKIKVAFGCSQDWVYNGCKHTCCDLTPAATTPAPVSTTLPVTKSCFIDGKTVLDSKGCDRLSRDDPDDRTDAQGNEKSDCDYSWIKEHCKAHCGLCPAQGCWYNNAAEGKDERSGGLCKFQEDEEGGGSDASEREKDTESCTYISDGEGCSVLGTDNEVDQAKDIFGFKADCNIPFVAEQCPFHCNQCGVKPEVVEVKGNCTVGDVTTFHTEAEGCKKLADDGDCKFAWIKDECPVSCCDNLLCDGKKDPPQCDDLVDCCEISFVHNMCPAHCGCDTPAPEPEPIVAQTCACEDGSLSKTDDASCGSILDQLSQTSISAAATLCQTKWYADICPVTCGQCPTQEQCPCVEDCLCDCIPSLPFGDATDLCGREPWATNCTCACGRIVAPTQAPKAACFEKADPDYCEELERVSSNITKDCMESQFVRDNCPNACDCYVAPTAPPAVVKEPSVCNVCKDKDKKEIKDLLDDCHVVQGCEHCCHLPIIYEKCPVSCGLCEGCPTCDANGTLSCNEGHVDAPYCEDIVKRKGGCNIGWVKEECKDACGLCDVCGTTTAAPETTTTAEPAALCYIGGVLVGKDGAGCDRLARPHANSARNQTVYDNDCDISWVFDECKQRCGGCEKVCWYDDDTFQKSQKLEPGFAKHKRHGAELCAEQANETNPNPPAGCVPVADEPGCEVLAADDKKVGTLEDEDQFNADCNIPWVRAACPYRCNRCARPEAPPTEPPKVEKLCLGKVVEDHEGCDKLADDGDCKYDWILKECPGACCVTDNVVCPDGKPDPEGCNEFIKVNESLIFKNKAERDDYRDELQKLNEEFCSCDEVKNTCRFACGTCTCPKEEDYCGLICQKEECLVNEIPKACLEDEVMADCPIVCGACDPNEGSKASPTAASPSPPAVTPSPPEETPAPAPVCKSDDDAKIAQVAKGNSQAQALLKGKDAVCAYLKSPQFKNFCDIPTVQDLCPQSCEILGAC